MAFVDLEKAFDWVPQEAENLHGLESTERMMVRWMCIVSLKDI